MRLSKQILQFLCYSLVFALLLSRAVSTGIDHDENQFISPGQLLADHGLIPYRDYPYTHMPYAIPLYALAAKVSSYDYLAARVLGALTWFACIVVLIAISRLVGHNLAGLSVAEPSWASLFGEFAIVIVFIYHPISVYLMGVALNHSIATLFSLLGFFLFLRGITGAMPASGYPFWSGACVTVAAFTRFNYASLVILTFALWLVRALSAERSRWLRVQGAFVGGVLVAGLPVFVLIALAPAPFYYGNIVYIRLNTLYYRGILWQDSMDLASKLTTFTYSVVHDPIDIVLYASAIVAGLNFLVRFARRKSLTDLIGLAAVAFAATLFLTAFSPTPTQVQYLFAPLPFMLITVALLGWTLYLRSIPAYVVMFLAFMGVFLMRSIYPSPAHQLETLLHPDTWTPLQVHQFANGLSNDEHVPSGRILSILPMLSAEAGYASYPFTATGPFSWRTSLLLTPQRRVSYGVTSPQELPVVLDAAPPVAILTGLEPPKAGFTANDLGGLERPFIEYAQRHGYQAISLSPVFMQHPVTLWVRHR
jgi:hypothetical protein